MFVLRSDAPPALTSMAERLRTPPLAQPVIKLRVTNKNKRSKKNDNNVDSAE